MKENLPVSVRLPKEVKDKLKLQAQKEQRSLSNLIVLILIQYLENK